jgi:hypothetical protein
MKIVLQRRSGQKQPVSCVQLSQLLRDLAFLVLNLVSFINYKVFPFEFHQMREANSESFEGCDNDIELPRLQVILKNILSELLSRNEVDDLHIRAPSLKFIHPIGDAGLRHNDHVVPFDMFEFPQEGE